jgi:hypothetical protein
MGYLKQPCDAQRLASTFPPLVTIPSNEKGLANAKKDPISVLFAASFMALAFWMSATVVTPVLSFLFLIVGAAPAQMSSLAAKSDHGMLLAMIVPFCAAALGFFGVLSLRLSTMLSLQARAR